MFTKFRFQQPMTTWEIEASRILRSELARYGLGPKELRVKLSEFGVAESERNLSNKIARGKFSFVFFLQCMRAMNVTNAHVAIDDEIEPARNRKPPRPKKAPTKQAEQVPVSGADAVGS